MIVIAVFGFYAVLFLPAQVYMFGCLLRAMPAQIDAQDTALAEVMREMKSGDAIARGVSTDADIVGETYRVLQRTRALQRRNGELLYAKVKSSHFHV